MRQMSENRVIVHASMQTNLQLSQQVAALQADVHAQVGHVRSL